MRRIIVLAGLVLIVASFVNLMILNPGLSLVVFGPTQTASRFPGGGQV